MSNLECSAQKMCPAGFVCSATGQCVAGPADAPLADARVTATPDAAARPDGATAVPDAAPSAPDARVTTPDAPPPLPDAPPPLPDAPPPDTTAPVVVLAGTPTDAALTNVALTALSWTFNPAEPGSSVFECSIDEGAFATANCANKSYADGAHTFAVRGRDAAGNVSDTKHVSWTLDTVAPTVTLDSADPANGAVSNDSTWTLAWSTSEADVVVECLVDGTMTMKPCPMPIGPLFDGVKTVQLRATDAAGNVGPYTAEISYTLRTSGPDVTITSKPADGDLPKNPSFTIKWTTDEFATFQCSYPGTANLGSCGSGTSGSFTGTGARSTNYMNLTSTDSLNNVTSTLVTWTWN